MKLDLHTHTKYSDGIKDVWGNVRTAEENGLDGIAITDHDCISSWYEIDQTNYPITVIKGLELSTDCNGETIHVLGYYLNDKGNYQELEEKLNEINLVRKYRVLKIIEKLKKLGIYLAYQDIEKFAEGFIARPHVARAIMEKYPDLHLTMNDCFDLYLGTDKPAYVPTVEFSIEEGINLLHRNHCLAVLAHPGLIKKSPLSRFSEIGLDGIEAIYSYKEGYRAPDNLEEFVTNDNLFITGGSDNHGDDNHPIVFLNTEQSLQFLEKINVKSNNMKREKKYDNIKYYP